MSTTPGRPGPPPTPQQLRSGYLNVGHAAQTRNGTPYPPGGSVGSYADLNHDGSRWTRGPAGPELQPPTPHAVRGTPGCGSWNGER